MQKITEEESQFKGNSLFSLFFYFYLLVMLFKLKYNIL